MDDRAKTMANLIHRHKQLAADSDSIMEARIENERATARVYLSMRDVLKRPDLAGVAVLDNDSDRVYFLDTFGIVNSLQLKLAEDVAIDQEESLVTTGEAS